MSTNLAVGIDAQIDVLPHIWASAMIRPVPFLPEHYNLPALRSPRAPEGLSVSFRQIVLRCKCPVLWHKRPPGGQGSHRPRRLNSFEGVGVSRSRNDPSRR